MITAKITCNSKQTYGPADEPMATVSFMPDYMDGRNKEWAAATPTLNLSMTVKGSVADQFEPGKKYTLTFEENED